jgi:hydroxymethylbilane synthase
MKQRTIRIGTRGSELALTQTRWVMKQLEKKFKRVQFELVLIKTTGDKNKSLEVFDTKNIGLFTKELEKHLKKRSIDLAIHSLKDLPTKLPKGLVLAATPKRESPRDVLVSKRGWTLDRLPEGATVGTASIRRERQLAIHRPDVEVVGLRGNVDTRVQKVLRGDLDAVIIAEAGLKRLKRFLRHAQPLPPDDFIPSAGQGILAIEARSSDRFARRIAMAVQNVDAACEAAAERECLNTLHGGCRVPVGIHARVKGSEVHIRAGVYSVEHVEAITVQMTGAKKRASSIGREAARILLRQGAGDYLREARRR